VGTELPRERRKLGVMGSAMVGVGCSGQRNEDGVARALTTLGKALGDGCDEGRVMVE